MNLLKAERTTSNAVQRCSRCHTLGTDPRIPPGTEFVMLSMALPNARGAVCCEDCFQRLLEAVSEEGGGIFGAT